MESDFEIKLPRKVSREIRESQIAERLAKSFNGQSFRSVSQLSGYNPETIRRYLHGASRIPADFVGQAASQFNLNAHHLLVGKTHVLTDSELRHVTTDLLICELGRRIRIIEDTAVGSAMIKRVIHA